MLFFAHPDVFAASHRSGSGRTIELNMGEGVGRSGMVCEDLMGL